MDAFYLAIPTHADADEANAYVKEHRAHGEASTPGSGGLFDAPCFEDWLERMHRNMHAATVTPGFVVDTTFIAKRCADDRWIGTIQIRHTLSDFLLREGGHIGYGVRPTERQKGYATQMLRKALLYCGHLKLDRVLVVCNADNVASARTIERCGGWLENEMTGSDGARNKRYWIDCQAPAQAAASTGFTIQPLDARFRDAVNDYVRREWGGPMMVTLGNTYDTSALPGFAAIDANGALLGALLYRPDGQAVEIAAMYALRQGQGIGRALLDAATAWAREAGMARMWLVTTNDNARALRFYQMYGFSLSAVNLGALTALFELKGELTAQGMDGITLAHEFVFDMAL